MPAAAFLQSAAAKKEKQKDCHERQSASPKAALYKILLL